MSREHYASLRLRSPDASQPESHMLRWICWKARVMSQWSWKVSGFGFRDFCSSFRMRQSLLGRWCDTVQNRNICMQMNSAGLQWIIQQKETYDVKGIKTNATWG